MYFSLPVEIIENDKMSFDSSLIPVDIKVMHNGLNLNNSTFFDEAIEDAKESLKNKPILGYVKKVDGTDEVDFAGHEIEIGFDEDGVKVTYLERPLGLVPETNNYSILEEDGKNFVFCRGYLWQEYLNSGYEILQDSPTKSVSMEIVVDDYDMNDDGSINIVKFRYLGITILGSDYPPAMQGAELSVVGQFSTEKHNELFSKMEKLNEKISNHFASKQNFTKVEDDFEGGESVEDEKFEEEIIEEMVEDTSEIIVEDTEEFDEEAVESTSGTSDDSDVEDSKFTKTFELSHDDVRSKLYGLLSKFENEDNDWYWINEVYDDYFIYSSDYKPKYYKQGYVKTDVDVALNGDRVEIFVEFLTTEELDELNKMRNDYSLILEENNKLKEFKAEKDKEEFDAKQEEVKQAKIDHINTEYGNISDDVKSLFISKVDEYETAEDIDADLCVYIVKNKVTFSKTKKESTNVKINIEDVDVNSVASPYGSLFNK